MWRRWKHRLTSDFHLGIVVLFGSITTLAAAPTRRCAAPSAGGRNRTVLADDADEHQA